MLNPLFTIRKPTFKTTLVYVGPLFLMLFLTLLLSACTTQKYHHDSPIGQHQASNDDMAATRISLGLGYLKLGNMSQAKFNLDKAKAFSPDLVKVYTAFAHYYEVVGENKLTRQSYEKALSIQANDADTLNNYGVFLCRQNEVPAAEVKFLAAIAVPSYFLVAESYQNLSSCYLQIDEFSKAAYYLSKSIDHSPNTAVTLLQMVLLQYAMTDYEEAKRYQQLFERNIRPFPAAYLALAYKVYRKLAQQAKADSYSAMLVEMYPTSWESQQYLLNQLVTTQADVLAKRYAVRQSK